MSNLTGKDLYRAMQNINKQYITEAQDVTNIKKRKVFSFSEKALDNIAVVAIVCVVIGLVIIAPKFFKNVFNGNRNEPATSAVETVHEDETQSEKSTDDDLSDETQTNALVENASLKYVYSKQKGRYIVSKEKSFATPDNWKEPAKGEVIFSDDLIIAFGNNQIVNTDNAGNMAYLVDIYIYEEVTSYDGRTISYSYNRLIDDELKEEYKRIKSVSNLDVSWAEKPSYNTESKIFYGVLTVDEMRNFPLNDGYGCVFSFISADSLKYDGDVDKLLYGENYEIISAK